MNTRSIVSSFLLSATLLCMLLLAVLGCGDDKLDPEESAFLEQVRKSLENNATAAEKTELFFEAVSKGYIYVIELLLENGVEINARDGCGQTPLFYAVDSNNTYLAGLLIENGADVNVEDKANRTPLYYAFQSYSWPMIKLLINNKAKVDLDDEYFYEEFNKAVKEGDVQLVTLLIEAGVDVTKGKEDGESLILLAASSHKDKTIFQMLIEAGPEIKQRTRLVTAEDGLRMRDKPTLEGEGLCVIPFEDSVLVLEEQEEEMTIGGKTGVWSLVQWNEQTGWVFGGFLTESITCIINIDGEDIEVESFKGTRDELLEMFDDVNNHITHIGENSLELHDRKNINIDILVGSGFILTNETYCFFYTGPLNIPEEGDIKFENDYMITFFPNSYPVQEYMGTQEYEKAIQERTTFKVWVKKDDPNFIIFQSDALTLGFKMEKR